MKNEAVLILITFLIYINCQKRNYNPIISPRKRKQVFKNNIYLNLVCQKNKKHKNMKLSKEILIRRIQNKEDLK